MTSEPWPERACSSRRSSSAISASRPTSVYMWTFCFASATRRGRLARTPVDLARVDLALQVLELVGDVESRLVAARRLLLQAMADDPAQVPGELGSQVGYRGGSVAQDRGGEVGGGVAREEGCWPVAISKRRTPSEKMSERWPAVAPCDLLGRHVGNGAEQHALASEGGSRHLVGARSGGRLTLDSGEAKSSTFTSPPAPTITFPGLRSRWTMWRS